MYQQRTIPKQKQITVSIRSRCQIVGITSHRGNTARSTRLPEDPRSQAKSDHQYGRPWALSCQYNNTGVMPPAILGSGWLAGTTQMTQTRTRPRLDADSSPSRSTCYFTTCYSTLLFSIWKTTDLELACFLMDRRSGPGEDSLSRCEVCEGESVVMQRCLHKRRYDCGRLLQCSR